MAIRPDWMTGTLNLVAGTPDFTTTGSALQTAAIQAGDAIITATGYVLIIAEITGQNSGRLFDNCPVAAAGDGQPLRVRYQPDGSRVQAAVRMMRELLTTGNLEAFAALVGEEDAVPVFVGPGVMKLVPKAEFGPDDAKGNLAALAALDNISNLSELAAIAKANDQFIIMGPDGTITLKSIKSMTDAIAENATAIGEKYTLPAGGTEDQLIDGVGALTAKSDLPISQATQSALNSKAEAAATQSALEGKLSISGGQMTGTVNGKTPPNSGNNQHGFFCGASFGSYDSTYNRSSPFVTRAQSAGSHFALSMKLMYAHAHESNPGATYSGTYALGVLNPNIANPGAFNILHTNADNQANKVWSFSGDSGGLNVPGPISKASGTWKIDHPLDPANKILRHGFVEAPEYVNIYRGVVRLVNGKATVNIDEYFGMMFGTFWAVNTDIMVSALQNQEGGTVVWPDGKMTSGTLSITCDDETCNDEIAWMVTGRRRDPYVLLVDPNCERGTGRFIPEIDKED